MLGPRFRFAGVVFQAQRVLALRKTLHAISATSPTIDVKELEARQLKCSHPFAHTLPGGAELLEELLRCRRKFVPRKGSRLIRETWWRCACSPSCMLDLSCFRTASTRPALEPVHRRSF